MLATAGFALSKNRLAAVPLLTRPIPKTGEMLPVIGLGTWQTFDVGRSESERAPLREVLRTLVATGGSVIDSSPMYGRSESVVGDLVRELKVRRRLFLATKVWTTGREAGIRQMEQSFSKLRTDRMDLLQVHNLVDWRTQLRTLQQWRENGRIRYIGVTHYTEAGYADLEQVLKAENLDFIQVNYSVAERQAEQRILPLARERHIAVLINRPFAQAGLFAKTQGKPMPAVAREIGCASWAQFFLKFAISHPAVTCVIPGTGKVEHLLDNLKAGEGSLPDSVMRERMVRAIAQL